MRFSEYIREMGVGAVTTPMATPSLMDTNLDSLNTRLDYDTDEKFMSPESGIQRIRRVLHLYGYDLAPLYDADPEGEELVIDLDNNVGVYILYTLADDNSYEFYAEVGNESRMQELLSDEGTEEEE